jgi:hypothetical protein
MLKFNPTASGMSIFMALVLGMWEWYFFREDVGKVPWMVHSRPVGI